MAEREQQHLSATVSNYSIHGTVAAVSKIYTSVVQCYQWHGQYLRHITAAMVLVAWQQFLM